MWCQPHDSIPGCSSGSVFTYSTGPAYPDDHPLRDGRAHAAAALPQLWEHELFFCDFSSLRTTVQLEPSHGQLRSWCPEDPSVEYPRSMVQVELKPSNRVLILFILGMSILAYAIAGILL